MSTSFIPARNNHHIVYRPDRQGFLLDAADPTRCTSRHLHATGFSLETALALAETCHGQVFRRLESIGCRDAINVGGGNPYTLAETPAGDHAIRRQGVTLIENITALPPAARNLILAMADELRTLRAEIATTIDPASAALRAGDLVPVWLPASMESSDPPAAVAAESPRSQLEPTA